MKTIKQIADELGVNKQAVEKRIARNADIQAHITKDEKGVKQISSEGEKLIRAAYDAIDKDIDTSTDKDIDKSIDASTDTVQTLISMLKGELEVKNKELEVKNIQIAGLNEALLNAQREAHAAQILHAADKPKLLMDGHTETPEEKPGLFRHISDWFKK